MADELNPLNTPSYDLLVASFTTSGDPVYRNEAWDGIFGTGEDIWNRLSTDDQVLAGQFLTDAAKGILVTNQVFAVLVPGRDEPLPVLMNFLPVHGGNGTSRIIAITVTGDVLDAPTTWTASQTQRNRMESLGRMTMGIAHDFNNLLTTILSHAEYMKISAVGSLFGANIDEHLHVIEQAALDGATLVHKIQQYVRQEKRTQHELLDLPTLIRDCLALTKPYWFNEARRQGITIHTRLDLRPVPPVLGNATELREVFVNLILNAVQAMPEGGTLKFQTKYSSKTGVVFSIADTGTGMAESVKRRIFEPLFTTKGEHGTGMGLAVTYGIVQEHNATITVDSKLGSGTQFEIAFPPAEAVEVEAPTPTTSPEVQAITILVVDDDAMVRSVICKLLTLKGHTVVEAGSGPEGLARARDQQFDLVFTDHGMPEMNGRQFAHALHAIRPELPIVLLTGDTEPGDPDEAVLMVLSKPFRIDKLQAAIHRLVERARSGSDLPE